MQLSNLDKKSLIELKDEIADLECRVKELSAIRVKQDVPLEVLLEQSSYKSVWDAGYEEAEEQAKLLGVDAPLNEKKLTYSAILESGKRYKVGGGVVSLFALKIFDGTGLFECIITYNKKDHAFCRFTAIPGEKYVLFEQALISTGDVEFRVREVEGHIRYVLAMSTFLGPDIKEVK